MISFDIINILNNNLITELDLNNKQINNINVLKCLENNCSLTHLNLSGNKINEIDILIIFNQVSENNYYSVYLKY